MAMPNSLKNLRVKIGTVAAIAAALFILWLPFGILNLVPFILTIPGESALRSHAGLAVGSLMIAAWGYWGR